MPSFFLAFLCALLLTAAGREGVRVARLASVLGAGTGLLSVITLSTIATTALAAWAGSLLGPLLPGPAQTMFVALALGVAAIELLVLRAPPPPREPTRSAGAMLLVLTAGQLTDSTRLVVAALALATGAPVLAAAGGTAGSALALGLAALAGAAWEDRVPLRLGASLLAFLLMAAAVAIALVARGIVS